MQKRKVSWYKLKTWDSRSVKTLSTTEKSLIMSLPLASPFFFYATSFLPASILSFPLHPASIASFCLSLAFFRDANYVKYSHDIRMLPQDHGLTVVPVDDSLNYSQRFPLRFHLRGFTSLRYYSRWNIKVRLPTYIQLLPR